MNFGHQKDNNKLINNISNLVQSNGQHRVLRTPNEGINQRSLKNWTDVADKICFRRT